LADGNENGSTSKCPTCRGALAMNKVIDYVTFKKVHNPEPGAEDVETASEASDSDDSETESEAESEDDVDSDGDLRDFIVPDDVEDSTADEDDGAEAEAEAEEGDDEAEFVPKAKSKDKSKAKAKSKSKSKGKRPAKDKKEKKEHLSIAMLKKEASKNAAGRKRYMKYLRKHWQPSAKLTKCVELLEQFNNDGQKTIVFSQFVSLLDLLQVPIEDKKWPMLRYDGGMSADARDAAVQKFTDTQTHNIMLISLKAGNSGLNLVAASRVIILDPFWNPYIEMQAVDRAYRIGQQNEVEVHRILIQGTVEDRIIELQEQKRKLVDSALDEGANKSLGRLDVGQLAFLFGV
jgi:SNF2 family DNA or RNA helicase